jgi:hypothetical protein
MMRHEFEALRLAEAALAEGQRNVAGTDDPNAEPDSTWAAPLRAVRAVLNAGSNDEHRNDSMVLLVLTRDDYARVMEVMKWHCSATEKPDDIALFSRCALPGLS